MATTTVTDDADADLSVTGTASFRADNAGNTAAITLGAAAPRRRISSGGFRWRSALAACRKAASLKFMARKARAKRRLRYM